MVEDSSDENSNSDYEDFDKFLNSGTNKMTKPSQFTTTGAGVKSKLADGDTASKSRADKQKLLINNGFVAGVPGGSSSSSSGRPKTGTGR